jgi:hypothetical protein
MPDKEYILGAVADAVADLLSYDRGLVSEALFRGQVTVEEMVTQFRTSLTESLKTGNAR